MGSMIDGRKQVITGVVPPQTAEAMVRELWPSVAAHPAVAGLGMKLNEVGGKVARTVILFPVGLLIAAVGWLAMAPFYFGKLLPFVARRYTLTNRRLMIRRGLKPKPSHEVALADIEDIRIHKDANSEFFMAGTLEVISKGQVVMRLAGVPGPEAFRHAILNTIKAWVPGRAADGSFIPASAAKK
jgi:Bacterial PH domain